MLDLDFLPTGIGLRETWERARTSGLVPEWMKALEIGATPSREVFSRGNLRLLEYLPQTAKRSGVPVVFLPSLINRHYVLDLRPGRSLVEYLVMQGFPVYMIEWLAPRAEDRYLTFDRLFSARISKALEVVASQSESGKFHLAGHCLGGTLAAIEASLRPERIQSLSLLTTPIDFSHAGKLGDWTKAPGFDVDSLVEAYGNVPWPLLQSSFQLLRPSLVIGKWSRLMAKWQDTDFLLSFLGLEIWSSDNVSFPGLCYATLIREFYQNNALVSGELRVEGRTIDLSKFAKPVLDVVAVDDHIVPLSTRWPAQSRVARVDLAGGHIGALLGGRAQKTFWPELSQWLKSHDSALH